MMKTPVTTTTIARNPFSIPNSFFSRQTFHICPSINLPLVAVVKCSKNENAGIGNENENGNGGSLKNILSGMVNESVIDELLYKEENRVLLDGLEQASLRVEMAKRDLAEIEKQEIEAKIMRDYINQLESKASEIEECQKEISEARAMVEEAERSLTVTDSSSSSSERFQSVKAASISAVIGTLVQIPISLTRVTTYSQLILPLSITFVTCALFGVTFRYAIRRDLDNFQLKSGTSAAFAFVKGLGMLGAGSALELNAESILSHAFDGTIYVSESLLIFLFAGVGLDLCIKLGILYPFPIDPSVTSSNDITTS